jgi:SAM-dependent methyltransferase
MCSSCSSASYYLTMPSQSSQDTFSEEKTDFYTSAVEDYAHQPYLTRGMLSITETMDTSSATLFLDSYSPDQSQLYSLNIQSSYYDISGRAPRWATHSSSDYSGTWLPQIARWGLLRYSKVDDRVLSNFMGRGTDVIEAFLLGRRPVGVDINPTAIALSQKNCTFAVPEHLRKLIRPQCRPVLVQGNSQRLIGATLFEDASYDLVLSHPPYHHAITYSTYIDGDLSRCYNLEEFQKAVRNVADETYRLLKPGKRAVLGIGDNREHCFAIPIGFETIREYLYAGFCLEELVSFA